MDTPTESPSPVMDVVPPKNSGGEPEKSPSVAPEKSGHGSSADTKQQQAPSKPKPTKGTGGAIMAAVVIVLGLAALAVYAYLHQP